MSQDSRPLFIDPSPSLKMVDGLIMRGTPSRRSVRALDTDVFTEHVPRGSAYRAQIDASDAPARRWVWVAIGAIGVAVLGFVLWAAFGPGHAASLPEIDRWLSTLGHA